MPMFKVQVILPMFTNLPDDVITNTYHFETVAPVTKSAWSAAISPLLRTFYLAAYASGGLAQYVNATACKTKVYDMSEPEPRIPVEATWASMSAIVAGSAIPTEVAVVLSMHGSPVPGIPLGRQRGRVFLGGLGTSWIVAGSPSSFPTLNPTAVSALDVAAGNFLSAVNALPDGKWVVWSPTAGQSFDVVGGHIDNSPDTQRRRSVAATSRSLWS